MIPITLEKGTTNTITIQAYDDLWAPNFDRITIHPVLSDEEATGIYKPYETYKSYETYKTYKPYETHKSYGTYSLDGRKLASAPSKGIFISGGRKMLRFVP